MTAKALSRHEIIMNFTMSPSLDDLAVMARQILESLPDELSASCEELGLQVEEFPDEAIEEEMDLETPYELLALFRSGKELHPGFRKKWLTKTMFCFCSGGLFSIYGAKLAMT